jgi:hypothetical protein
MLLRFLRNENVPEFLLLAAGSLFVAIGLAVTFGVR